MRRFLFASLVVAVFIWPSAWATMLFFGFVHSSVLAALAPISYKTALALCLWVDFFALTYGVGEFVAQVVFGED